MSGYTKLFSSIVTSTIWRESDHVRLVWVTMLALADQHGVIEASVPGLADMARVSRSLCEDAIRVLSSPDPDSRTKDADGRRVEECDGGWKLINHRKYREKMSDADRRARRASYMREYRKKSDSVTAGVTDRNSALLAVTEVAHAEADQKQTKRGEWSAHDWKRKFADAWGALYGGFYGGGSADAKAVSALSDVLAALPVSERQAAQLRGAVMFAEFLAEGGDAAKRRHPFVFFVARFNGLRVEQKRGQEPREAVAGGWRSSTGDKI